MLVFSKGGPVLCSDSPGDWLQHHGHCGGVGRIPAPTAALLLLSLAFIYKTGRRVVSHAPPQLSPGTCVPGPILVISICVCKYS
jgi:hypothetical protein